MPPNQLAAADSAEDERKHISRNTLLLAEDNAMFRMVLQSWLEGWGYQVKLAEDGSKAWEVLQQEEAPELLILDWMMPGIDGLELCRRVRAREGVPYQYILLVTAKGDRHDVVAGLEAGADDYLTKPFDTNELRSRLNVGKRILRLQHELIEAREELRHRATHDGLTGIWNRVAMLELLQLEVQRSIRAETSTGVLMLDLDHFKKINDTYGHPIGDMVLKEVADRIARAVRGYDLVGRYGGEEFLVVLPHCSKECAGSSAERIRRAVADRAVAAAGIEIAVTVSIGAAVAAQGTASEADVIAAADAALYRAKKAGRNRAEIS
jgi:two-component system cell cycle response regulator